jgi:hypothetical protein
VSQTPPISSHYYDQNISYREIRNPHHNYQNIFPSPDILATRAIMADAPPTDAGAAAPTEPMAKLLLDEPTGEMVSKSELKKRQKNRQKEEEKAKKAAAAPPKPATAKKSNAEADEKELNPNVNIFHMISCSTKTILRAAC